MSNDNEKPSNPVVKEYQRKSKMYLVMNLKKLHVLCKSVIHY